MVRLRIAHLVFLSLLLLLGKPSKAQTYKFWMGDTLNLYHNYTDEFLEADTDAFIKPDLDTITNGTVVIYYDKEMTQRFSESRRGKSKKSDDPYRIRMIWHKNGQLWVKDFEKTKEDWDNSNYVLNVWYADGKRKIETIDSGYRKKQIEYYHSGKIRQIDVHIKGAWKLEPNFYAWVYTMRNCENGQLILQDSVNCHHVRMRTRYYCNGNKDLECTTNGIAFFNLYTKWYENGKIDSTGNFDTLSAEQMKREDPGDPKYHNKQGKWSYYNENGKLVKEAWYEDNMLISKKEY
ncbi:MAG TPA: hypothetical protein VK890_06410 [Bacteroidia bacterium]|nr:hypothetical protein [Bacteroidia bacterium]